MTPEHAITLLRKHASDPQSFDIVLRHSQRVAEIAVGYAKQIGGMDLNFIECAALLHDIGRFQCPPGSACSSRHGFVGAELLRAEGVDEAIARVAERHVGAGISRQDIIERNLDLPHQDFLPVTREEKIITHSDNLGKADRRWTMEEAVERHARGISPAYGERVRALGEEVEHMGK